MAMKFFEKLHTDSSKIPDLNRKKQAGRYTKSDSFYYLGISESQKVLVNIDLC